MEGLPEQLKELFERIDKELEPITDFQIDSKIKKITKQLNSKDEELETSILAESIAFMFCEDYSDQKTGWGTYYGPMAVFKGENGRFYENPSIERINSDIINYWQERAKESKHPILKVRYADLVWDFSKKVTDKSADISNAYIIIDASLEIVNQKLYDNIVQVLHMLPRALSVALSVRDTERIENTINTILNFENEVLKTNYPHHCGFAFDNLFIHSVLFYCA